MNFANRLIYKSFLIFAFLLNADAVLADASQGPTLDYPFYFITTLLVVSLILLWHTARQVKHARNTIVDMETHFDETQAFFKRALDLAPVPVCLLEGDEKGRRFTYVNDECLRILGYSRDEMLGKNATEMMFINDDDRAFYLEKAIKSIQTGVPFKLEMPLYKNHKVVSQFEFNSRYEMLNGRLHGVLFVLNIEERKRREQKILDAKDSAEELANQISLQKEQQAQMYAVMGHELRTPAAALKMLLEDAKAGGNDLDVDLLGKTVDQLLGVIDMLRSVAQPESLLAGSAEAINLCDLITSQVAILESVAKTYGIKIRSECDALPQHLLNVQVQIVRQLISNLLKNAIVHSGGSSVLIGANGRQKGNNLSVEIWVEDNGTGIEEDEIDRLFLPYQRGNSNSEGTGLGLYICREIAHLISGDLRFESNPQGGSRFIIQFEADILSDSKHALDERFSFDGMRILVAEDNATLQMLTQRMLERSGAIVTITEDGQEALERYKNNEFDLILSDIFMPVMDGYALVKSIRQLNCRLPIVGLTAATIGDETKLMLEAGADTVISKPLSIQELSRFMIKYSAYDHS
jgi:PAS domain S-box-containing protein